MSSYCESIKSMNGAKLCNRTLTRLNPCERSERRFKRSLNRCDRLKCKLFLFFLKFFRQNKMSSNDNSSDDERKSERYGDEDYERSDVRDEEDGSESDCEDFPDVDELKEIFEELELKPGSREKKDWVNKMVEFYKEVEPEYENDERLISECLQWLKKC